MRSMVSEPVARAAIPGPLAWVGTASDTIDDFRTSRRTDGDDRS